MFVQYKICEEIVFRVKMCVSAGEKIFLWRMSVNQCHMTV